MLMDEEQNRPGLSKEQKIGFVLLLFFAVFALGLGILQIRNTMYAPFSLSKKIPALKKEDINSAEALAYRDTDRDGVNDFDELFIYQTSAYIADTDSDGIPDKEEITKGTNPLCPEGKNCGDLENPGVIPMTMSASSSFSAPEENILTLEDMSKLGSSEQIRKMLLDAGMDSATLDKISDEELLNSLKEAAGSTTTR